MSSTDISIAVSISAFIISGATFIVNSWRWSRTRRSDELKVARDITDRLAKKTERLDDFFNDHYQESSEKEIDAVLRKKIWQQHLSAFLSDAEEFKYHVENKEITHKYDIYFYKVKLKGHLSRAQTYIGLIPPPDTGFIANWIKELIEWCDKGLKTESSKGKESKTTSVDG